MFKIFVGFFIVETVPTYSFKLMQVRNKSIEVDHLAISWLMKAGVDNTDVCGEQAGNRFFSRIWDVIFYLRFYSAKNNYFAANIIKGCTRHVSLAFQHVQSFH